MKPAGDSIPLTLQFTLNGAVCEITTINPPPPVGFGFASGAGLGTYTITGTVTSTGPGLLATKDMFIRFPGGEGLTIEFYDGGDATGTFYGEGTVGAIVANGKFTFTEFDLQQ